MKRADVYRPRSWIDPRTEIRRSPLHGRGTFATQTIRQDEIVTIWGGTLVLTDDDIAGPGRQAWLSRGYVWAWIGEGSFLAEYVGGAEDLTELINHGCVPNVWFADEVTLMASRDISVGEELLLDYATFEGNEGFVAPWQCRCGSPLCRGVVTGRDWRRVDLRERYRGHFSPFINDRIRKQLAREITDRAQLK